MSPTFVAQTVICSPVRPRRILLAFVTAGTSEPRHIAHGPAPHLSRKASSVRERTPGVAWTWVRWLTTVRSARNRAWADRARRSLRLHPADTGRLGMGERAGGKGRSDPARHRRNGCRQRPATPRRAQPDQRRRKSPPFRRVTTKPTAGALISVSNVRFWRRQTWVIAYNARCALSMMNAGDPPPSR